ncbi:MAG: hypothetical protein L6R39_007373, partial [Caloplaca ligustica]
MRISPPLDQLPTLSTTSPINKTSSTEDTFSQQPDSTERPRKFSRADAQSRQRRIAAIQSARREVRANIKEDWIWPPTACHRDDQRFPRRKASTRWRERESDSSPLVSRSPSPSSQDPYRFQSPDAVGVLPSMSRRAKRRKVTREEMEWNEGLRLFIERRDFWTGAETRPTSSSQDEGQPEEKTISSVQPVAFTSTTPVAQATPIGPSDSDTSTLVSNLSLDASASLLSSTPPSARTSQSSELLPSTLHYDTTSISTPSDPPPAVLVPLAPPLLSPTAYPDLAAVTPAIYPIIYSKCVLQSLAPSFPINLKDV